MPPFTIRVCTVVTQFPGASPERVEELITDKIEKVAQEYGGRLKVVKVDIDNARQTASKFGVMSVPTVLLIQGGAVKDQVVGLVSKQALADRVDKVL